MEFQLHQRLVSRLRLNCSFLENSRVFNKPRGERSFDIFFQMLAGLSDCEKHSLQLSNTAVDDLKYLSDGRNHVRVGGEVDEYRKQFRDWRKSVEELGISFFDVMKVFAAVLLIGNIDLDTEDDTETEVESVSKLLSIKKDVLIRGLTIRTQKISGEICRRNVDKKHLESIKNSLATSLYVRTVNTIVKRINCLNPSGSVRQQTSQDTPCSFLILDSFGLQRSACGLEKLCMNLCTETMQVITLLSITSMLEV